MCNALEASVFAAYSIYWSEMRRVRATETNHRLRCALGTSLFRLNYERKLFSSVR